MTRFLPIPRETKFFDLIEKGAANLVTAAKTLVDLVENFEDTTNKVARITDLEHEGDHITHELMGQLHRTFVTPLDREDISLLAQRIDDMMDFMEGAANAMLLYKITQPTSRAREQAAILIAITDKVNKAVVCLRNKGQLKRILEHCVEINRLENEADAVIRQALAELFDDTVAVTEIIKWREIYEHLENAADRGEDIANVLEGVVLKHG